jgi:NADPH:quinone reductase-like Zn-dependent oxidoreductase
MVELLGKKHHLPVINIVRNQKQVELLKGEGSLYVLNSSEESFISDLGKLSEELKATVLFDSVCSRQLQKIIEVLPDSSSVIIYGNLSGEEQIMVNPRSLIGNNITISGFYLGERTKENSLFRNMLNLMEVSRLMSRDMKIKIQGRFPLIRAQEAVDTYLNNMTAGKVILVPGSG